MLVTGNTYPVKDKLRELGGRWIASQKAWDVPEDKFAQAQELVASAPESTPRYQRKESRYRSNYARFSSGAEWYQNKRGRCEDAPCCGCCS